MDGKARQLSRAGQFLLGIAVVMLTSDSVLMLSTWADRLLSLTGCLALTALCAADRGNLRRNLVARTVMVAWLAAFAWEATRLEDPIARTILVAWFFGFLRLMESRLLPAEPGRIEQSAPSGSSVYTTLHVASLLYALGCALYRRSDGVWAIAHGLSASRLLPGPSVSGWMYGLPAYLFGATILGSGALLEQHHFRTGAKRRLAGLAVLLAGCFLGVAALRLGVPTTHLIVSVTHAASLGLVASVAVWAGPPLRSGGMMRLTVALTLAVAAFLAWPGAAGRDGSGVGAGNKPQVTFALYPAGLLDWRVPDARGMGLLNSGMFGLFRLSLERQAADTGGRIVLLEAAPGPAITSEKLSDAAAVLLINPTVRPGPDEIDCLRAYVESGGGLLVLGDHTDIGGSRAALNGVLSFTGIQFNFDSAVPLRPHWQGCLEVRPHAVTRRLREAPGTELRAQLAVGASLALTGTARALVLGRYGFADCGDPLNYGAGAFLGNMARDRWETAGGLVLVACQEIGEGRVLVFGDTSPFQNGALFLSQDLVSDAVSWVCWPAAGRNLNLSPYPEVAAVDFSLHPRARVSLFRDASLGGLANCLARRQMTARPVFSRDQWDDAGRYLFLVAPTWVGDRDKEQLLRYMQRGGSLILCQGYTDPQPCEQLLKALGLAITSIPLGNGDPRCPAAHRDAWALACTSPAGATDTTVIASAFGHPTAVVKPHGLGNLTLVGDGGLLLDDNLESERGANARNVAFLGDLLGPGRRACVEVDSARASE